MKNISNAPIVGLRMDEYCYIGQKEVAVGSGKLRTRAGARRDRRDHHPAADEAGHHQSQLMFTHANGKVKPRA